MNLKSIIKKSVLVSMLAITTAAFGQKDILLYSTDFTDWGAVDGSSASSSDVLSGTQGGAGFSIMGRPVVDPATGTLSFGNSSCYIETKKFDFVSGAVIEVEFYANASNAREITLSETVTQVKLDYTDYVDGTAKITDGYIGNTMMAVASSNISTTPEDDRNVILPAIRNGEWQAGSKFKNPKYQGATYTVSFNMPSVVGEKSIQISGMNKDVFIKSLKIYTSVGTTPYVASPSYPNAGADGSKASSGLAVQALPGGNVVDANVDIKAYNITSPVSLSIIGDGAAQFSLTQTTIDASAALAGTSIPVKFTSTSTSSISQALLVISAAGAENYYVNLLGQSGTGNPEIIADNSLLKFYTFQTGRVTQTIDVSGLSLTGPITATLSDGNFSVPSSEISLYNALKGSKLKVTFTGDIVEGTKDATLTLSSPGAADVVIPLQGVTTLEKPHVYPISFVANPAGSAAIKHTPGGSQFLEGEKITVTVTPNTGYNIVSWSDNAGSTKKTRVITATMTTPAVIIVNLSTSAPVGPSGGGGAGSSFVARPATNVTANSLTANWSAATNSVSGATTTYTVTLYDAAGNQVDQQQVGTALTAQFTGLSSYTPYYYQVRSTSTDEGQTETNKVGPFYTVDDTVYVCGE